MAVIEGAGMGGATTSNLVSYSELESQLSTLIQSAEDTKTNLEAMDTLIDNYVGPAGSAWSGDSATAFKTSWDGLAEEIPDFITTVENQGNNLKMMLDKTKAVDTDADGRVNMN